MYIQIWVCFHFFEICFFCSLGICEGDGKGPVLMEAIYKGHPEIVRLLCTAEKDINLEVVINFEEKETTYVIFALMCANNDR